MAPEPQVGEISEADIPDVAAFLARQARTGEAIAPHPLPPVERLRWLLLENPARAAEIPLGWRIRANGSVVGAAVCIPFRIGITGFTSTALMFAKFYVDRQFRGMGLGLLMRFVREGKRFPLFVTSTNAVSGAMFAKLGASLIPGMDHTMLGVARLAPLVEEAIYRRVKSPAVARAMAFPARMLGGWGGRSVHGTSRGELIRMPSANAVAALHLALRRDALAVIRDRDYLHWRYFTGEMDKDVYCFRLPGEGDRMLVVNLVRSGHRGQIRVLNVLDVWPPATAIVASSLVAGLAHAYRGKFDAIWLRSQSAGVEATLQQRGWRQHSFPAPLGWSIDRENRLPTRDWYLMPGESE